MELTAQQLYRRADAAALPFSTTAEVTPSADAIAQQRAKDAIDFAVGMRFQGYNLYALGSPLTDKQSTVMRRLKDLVSGQPDPEDWCYLRNFQEPERPTYVSLPAGEGRHFRRQMLDAVNHIREVLPATFASEDFRNEAQALSHAFRETQSKDVAALEEEARSRQLAMLPTPNGFVFAPTRDGKVMEQEDFLALPEGERQTVQKNISDMSHRLMERLQNYPKHEQELLNQQRALQRRTAEAVVRHSLARLRTRHRERDRIMTFLQGAEEALLDNLDRVVAGSEASRQMLPMPGADPESFFAGFRVNLLVDHTGNGGPPIVYESNPSLDNLIGKVTHRVEFGVPVSDFSMISAGAMHRANGGYLVLDAERVLGKPFAWEALKRALTDRSIRIESVNQLLNLSYTVSLEPEAIPLQVKVVLLGTQHLYQLLRAYDADFDELFKVVADFDDHVAWTDDNLAAYTGAIARIVGEADVRQLTADGVARVIEHCSRAVDDRERLSTYVTDVRDLLQEADYLANQDGAAIIDRAHVDRALQQRTHRLDRFRELVRDSIVNGQIVVRTSGSAVGQINGLSVISMGHVRFGQPSRITATARIGSGELIDIERESKLGGKIHSKAVMIVAAFLGARYARNTPLSLRASLVFEQSYAGVEGDSASIAEVCALISAIIDQPILQCWAITGSMDQHGTAQAIGGVNEKIEGFFDLCNETGLTGEQGVIIPEANQRNLMLREDVVRAVAEQRFHVHTVATVDDAMALLFADAPGNLARVEAIDERVRARVEELYELSRRKADTGETP